MPAHDRLSPPALVCILLVVAQVCAPAQAKTDGTPRTTVDKVVLHAVAGPMCKEGKVVFTTAAGDAGFWNTFFANHAVLGIHYIIDRQGTTVTGIPETQVANHAKGNNATSIGIELVNNGDGRDPFPERQIEALIALLKEVTSRWNIAPEEIVTHSFVDKRTFECAGAIIKLKQDPGPAFPLAEIRRQVATPPRANCNSSAFSCQTHPPCFAPCVEHTLNTE